jgi:hypothetical protein
MLKYPRYYRPDFGGAVRVSKQVSDHPNILADFELDENDEIGAGGLKCRMHRVPDALPTENPAPWHYLLPPEIKRMTMMANPLRTPLEALALATALDKQSLGFQPLPIGCA